MAERASISVEEMRDKASAIENDSKSMANSFTGVEGAIKNLKPYYTGPAADDLYSTIAKMDAKFEQFKQVVASGVKSMRDQAQKWEDIEKKVSDIQKSASSQYK